MLINKMVSKIYISFALQVAFSYRIFFGMVFVVSIISSQVVAESSKILANYLPCFQLNVVGFSI